MDHDMRRRTTLRAPRSSRVLVRHAPSPSWRPDMEPSAISGRIIEKRQHREPWRVLLTARRFRTSGNTTQPRPVVGRSERPAPPSLADWAHCLFLPHTHTHNTTTTQSTTSPTRRPSRDDPMLVPPSPLSADFIVFDPITGVDAFLPPGRADGKDVLGIG